MLSTVLNRSVNQSHKPPVFISWLFVFKVTVLLKKSIFNCCCLAGCLISQIRSCVKEEEGSHTAGLTYSKLLNAPQMWYFQPICIFIRWCPLVSEVDYLLSKVFVSLTRRRVWWREGLSWLHLKFGAVQCAKRLSLSMRDAECVDVQNYLCGTFGPSSNEAHFNRNMEKLTVLLSLYQSPHLLYYVFKY